MNIAHLAKITEAEAEINKVIEQMPLPLQAKIKIARENYLDSMELDWGACYFGIMLATIEAQRQCTEKLRKYMIEEGYGR